MNGFLTSLLISTLVGTNYSINFTNSLGEVIKSATKPISKAMDSVARQSTGNALQFKDCFEDYSELGCFSNIAPWFSALRPFPLPMSPKDIDAKVYLYTSKYPNERFIVKLWKNISISGSDFDAKRPYTAFITHGFSHNGNMTWLKELKNAYLKKREANVFVLDWGKGASVWSYLQVAANTRVVGAELKRFIKYLVEVWHQDPARIHLMGHSLGAHIMSYAAKGVPGVGKLSAFDPAQPGFEGTPSEVRLTKNDAKFVEVIHTNIRPIIPLLGFGLILPSGHIDYYMNGGALQPGCVSPPVHEINLKSIADLGKISVDVISAWVDCSHSKSYKYYIEALLNDYCTFWGRSTGYLGTALEIATFGRSGLTLEKFDKCTLDKCSPIGLESDEYPARGVFSVSTSAESPYCQNDPVISKQMKELRQQKLQDEVNGKTSIKRKEVLGIFGDVFKPLFQ